VLFGPHTQNARHAVEILERSGAGRRVEDAPALASALVDLLGAPERAQRLGAAGRQALSGHRGSAERTAQLIEALLGEAARPAC
jgi:3-deoxy-D-manno-octulosonic-acid transferase